MVDGVRESSATPDFECIDLAAVGADEPAYTLKSVLGGGFLQLWRKNQHELVIPGHGSPVFGFLGGQYIRAARSSSAADRGYFRYWLRSGRLGCCTHFQHSPIRARPPRRSAKRPPPRPRG